MKKKRWIVLGAVIAALSMLFAVSAVAQVVRHKPVCKEGLDPLHCQRVIEVTFGQGDVIEGGLDGPGDGIITGRDGPTFKNLVQIREDFRDKILQDARAM